MALMFNKLLSIFEKPLIAATQTGYYRTKGGRVPQLTFVN